MQFKIFYFSISLWVNPIRANIKNVAYVCIVLKLHEVWTMIYKSISNLIDKYNLGRRHPIKYYLIAGNMSLAYDSYVFLWGLCTTVLPFTWKIKSFRNGKLKCRCKVFFKKMGWSNLWRNEKKMAEIRGNRRFLGHFIKFSVNTHNILSSLLNFSFI